VRRVRRAGPGGGEEVARRRGPPAGPGSHLERGRDRGGGQEDRGGREQGDRRRVAPVSGILTCLPSATPGRSSPRPGAPRGALGTSERAARGTSTIRHTALVRQA